MYNLRVERSAGYAGVAFVIVLFASALLPGVPPPADAPPAEIGAYFDAHRTMWLLSAWLAFPAMALFLWFIVQLRAFLRLAPQVDDGLPTYMLAAGIATAAISIVGAVCDVAMTFHPSTSLGDPVVRALYDIYNAAGTLILMPVSILVFAASHSGRRHASLPPALVYWGYLTAVLAAIETLSVFFTSGFLALGGIGGLVIGVLPVAIWVLWTSFVLIRTPRG
jgi:hypothetical protein